MPPSAGAPSVAPSLTEGMRARVVQDLTGHSMKVRVVPAYVTEH